MTAREIIEQLLPETPFKLVDKDNHVIDLWKGENTIDKTSRFEFVTAHNVTGIAITDYLIVIYIDYKESVNESN